MKWRVYNVHPDGLTHREKFRGDDITIKAGEYILMDYEDAVLFRGQYFPMMKDAGGQQTRESMKFIKIEMDDPMSAKKVAPKYICQVDGKEFPSQAELDAYVEAKYGDLEPFRDETIEAELEKQAAMQAAPKKRGPKPKLKEETLP